MNNHDIKFILNFEGNNHPNIEDGFNKAKSILNWRFDENLNAQFTDSDIDYQLTDITNLKESGIEEIIESFFKSTFDNVIDVPLYKFLVLKNNEKLMLLANINSLIFDYTSINEFYELFDDSIKTPPKYYLDQYYEDVKDYLNSIDFEKDSTYWRNHILNSSSYVNFYNIKNNASKRQEIPVNNDSILNFTKDHDCHLFDFYASIFALYLSRIDRLEGCLLKTIIPRKNDLESFDKTTYLKIDVSKQDSFNDLLNEFNSTFKNASNHGEVDVDNYLDENVSYYSIYDFNDLNENIDIYNGDDSALTLNIYNDYLEIVYNSELFSDEYVKHMAKNIESLISNVLDSPNQEITNIDILSDEEKALISDYCKGKTIEVDEDKLFCHSFRQYALESPDTIAVDDGVNQITYAEMEKSSNSIANDLYENHNIGPGSRVGLMLPRTYRFLELALALNKVGAAYVPIDVRFPVNRIGHMLTIAQAEHIITTSEIAQKLDLNAKIICLEDLNDQDDVDLEILSETDDVFAIIFTSGTTGIPKGVMFYNRQFPWACAAYKEMFNFNPGNVVGSYFSFSFGASLVVNASLYLGGSVRIFNEEEQKNSLLLIKALKETHMNNLVLPPSLGIPIFENEDLNLDYLVLSGARLNELSKKDRHTKLVNIYGTTEVVFAISKIYDLKNIKDNRVPIGKPVANTWVYILDENNNRMPVGVPGEICVSREIIGDVYCNAPELMDELFVDNPFSDNKLNRTMYRTGDIGFYNYDGEIEIIGREDSQLSVRGFRIESNEILTIMKGFKEISDIYLDVDNDNLVAYYTTTDNLDINEVKEALENELPYYMIPSIFIELEKIPLNINGKIDKSSLKTVVKNEDIEIADEVIRSIVDAFKEVLKHDSVLIDDDFVSLGGNSLSAMQLQLILKEKLGVSISSNEIIELSTPNEIGNHIKYNLNVHSEVDEDIYTFDEPCPLSESQLNVYLDESANDMGTAYNNSFKIDFKDDYSSDEIKGGLMKLFEAFPILKARVSNDNEVPSLVFDGNPEIIEGSLNDINTFVKEFEFDRCLSRFLIVEDESSTILCADFHHIIFDGTSLNILLNVFFAILNGENIDFVDKGTLRQISFEENVASAYMDEAHEFFESMLADNDEVYELLDCVDGDDEFEYIDTFDMDNETLSQFLQSHSMTYNQFFTSVFAYTLSRFSGSDKVLFDIIEDGRGHIDLTSSVGMYVKTLPVLIDCKNQNIDSYLEYSSNLINSVMKYDFYPFRVLANEHDLNTDIQFQYSHDLFIDAMNKESMNYSIDELKHDLDADFSFYIMNNGTNRFTIRILYSSSYSKSFIKRFTESYKSILHEMTRVSELKDIDFTSSGDIELLDACNQTERILTHGDILDAFNDNLSKHPENRLVMYNDVSYTYGEGAFIATAIAKKLAELGIENQDCVSFLVPRSELYMFCVLGILSAGCIYVPLDDKLPDEQVQFILDDSASKAVIVSDETYDRTKSLSEDSVILNISDIFREGIETLPSLPVTYGSLACILYTSGTTGIPKGVKITRKSILNLSEFYIQEYGLSHDDVYALFASIGFDVAMKAIFSTICSGACLTVIPNEVKLDINAMNSYFIRYGVTHTEISTPVAKLFISQNTDTSLKVMTTGGEKLGEIVIDLDYRFVDSYGPTEACVDVTSIDVDERIDSSSIGHLQNNVKAYVLDNEFRRVPPGAVGELCVSGIPLADGYLNRDEETANAFIANPFDDNEDFTIIYRTGDMVRVLPDGSFGILGRRDGQVKIRGNRVELSEVEATIRKIDYVDDVTVQSIENKSNNELVAYVVASSEMDENDLKEDIQNFVRQHKPDYMVPAFIVTLDEIPLNINGKVDKRALPDVDLSALHTDYVAPRTEIERIIVEAFEKVFDDKIGIYDDFVRLGGDSLSALKVLSAIGDYGITVADIMSLRTPHAIAGIIKEVPFDLDIFTVDEGCPLNNTQLYMYTDVITNNKKDAYKIPYFKTIPKKYSVEDICSALDKLFEVHPILTMHISLDNEIPYLVKGDNPPIIIASPEDDFEDIMKFLAPPFDLYGNLSRYLIFEDDDNYYLTAVFHHIMFDEYSAKIFDQNLMTILEGGTINEIDDSFLKISAFHHQMRQSEEFSQISMYAQTVMGNLDEVGFLPGNGKTNTPSLMLLDLEIDNELLKSYVENAKISENILFTGAFAYTLSKLIGKDDITFGIIENGRDRFQNFDSVGLYINPLPMVMNCRHPDIQSFMEYASQTVYDMMKYNFYPFSLAALELGIEPIILFQYLPGWINDESDEVSQILSSYEDLANEFISNLRDFMVASLCEVIQRGDTYNLRILHSHYYSKEIMEHFAQCYKQTLSQIISGENPFEK